MCEDVLGDSSLTSRNRGRHSTPTSDHQQNPLQPVTLFGTSAPEHLRANIASLLKPPLPEADRQQLATLFGHLLGVGLELPDNATAY